jgi:hypothetical protein
LLITKLFQWNLEVNKIIWINLIALRFEIN